VLLSRDEMRRGRILLEDDCRSAARRTAQGPGRGYLGRVSLRRIYARVQALDPLIVDFLLAAVIAAATIAETLLREPDGSRVTNVIGALALIFPLTWRRRDPVLATILYLAVLLAEYPFDGYLFQSVEAPFVGLLVMIYSLGRHADGRRLWIGLGISLVLVIARLLLGAEEGPGEAFWLVLVVLPPFLAGRALRGRMALQAELREKAAQAEAARLTHAEVAADDERERIAAKLQVDVADAVSAIVVQAKTVTGSLEAGETRRAEESFAQIEATGRDALAEMRSLLGVLRHDGEGPELAPQPGLARLAALIERVREQGIEVDLSVSGDERPPLPGVDLTAYRVIQDALEAAVEQGASRAEVELHYGERDLDVAVRDDRSGGASHRLPGLRDRVGLYGGHLRAGRRDNRGFALESRLPLSEVGA
jgi:signal transduction histidine kinase